MKAISLGSQLLPDRRERSGKLRSMRACPSGAVDLVATGSQGFSTRVSSKKALSTASFVVLLSATGVQVAAAADFLKKRECTIGRPSRAPVHTHCVISGGMQNGRNDVSIKMPDGKTFALEGPIDGESGTDGYKYLLENLPARLSDGATTANAIGESMPV